MEKSTQKWSTTLFVCPHTDPKRDTSHFSPPSRANTFKKGAANKPVDMMTSSAISSILLICWNPRFYNKQYLFVFCLSFLSEARLQMSLPRIPWLLPLEARSGLLIRFFDCQDVGHTSRYYMAVILEFNFGNFVDSRYIVPQLLVRILTHLIGSFREKQRNVFVKFPWYKKMLSILAGKLSRDKHTWIPDKLVRRMKVVVSRSHKNVFYSGGSWQRSVQFYVSSWNVEIYHGKKIGSTVCEEVLGRIS